MGAIRGFIGPLWKKFLQKIGAEAVEQGGMSTANKEVTKWMAGEGGEQYIKNRAAEQGIKGWGEETAKSGAKSGGSGMGRTILSVAIGVGIALAFPGVGLAGQLVLGALVETGGEAAVGVVINKSATSSKPAAPDDEDGAQVTGMVPDDGGSTVQRQDSDPREGQPSAPNTGPFVGGTTTGTTPHDGTSTTTTTTTTTEESTTTHEKPHEPPPAGHEDPHEDFDD